MSASYTWDCYPTKTGWKSQWLRLSMTERSRLHFKIAMTVKWGSNFACYLQIQLVFPLNKKINKSICCSITSKQPWQSLAKKTLSFSHNTGFHYCYFSFYCLYHLDHLTGLTPHWGLYPHHLVPDPHPAWGQQLKDPYNIPHCYCFGRTSRNRSTRTSLRGWKWLLCLD